VQWVRHEWREHDLVLTTHLGLPALWWYGDTLGAASTQGSPFAAGTRVAEMQLAGSGPDCERDDLRRLLDVHPRVLVFLGFPDRAAGFDDLLMTQLRRVGRVREERRYAVSGLVALVEAPDADDPSRAQEVPASTQGDPSGSPGCVVVRPAGVW
jgi:hypothetical protein